jgi:hypothetical protein
MTMGDKTFDKITNTLDYLVKFKLIRPMVLLVIGVILPFWLIIWYVFDLED